MKDKIKINTEKYDINYMINNFISALIGENSIETSGDKIYELKLINEEYQKDIEEIKKSLINEKDQNTINQIMKAIEKKEKKITNGNNDIQDLEGKIAGDFNRITADKITKESICKAAYYELGEDMDKHEGLISIDKVSKTFNNYLSSIKEVLFADTLKEEIKDDFLCNKINNVGKSLSNAKKSEIQDYQLTNEDILYNFQKNIRTNDMKLYFEKKRIKLLGVQYIKKIKEENKKDPVNFNKLSLKQMNAKLEEIEEYKNKNAKEYVVSYNLTNENITEYAKALRDMKKVLDTRKFKDKIFSGRHYAQMDVFKKAKKELTDRGVSSFYLNSYLRSSDKDAEKKLEKLLQKSEKDILKYNKNNTKLREDLNIKEDKKELAIDGELLSKVNIKENKIELAVDGKILSKEREPDNVLNIKEDIVELVTDGELLSKEQKIDNDLNIVDGLDDDFTVDKDKTSDAETIEFNEDELNFDKKGIIISDGEFEFDNEEIDFANKNDTKEEVKQKDNLEIDEISKG